MSKVKDSIRESEEAEVMHQDYLEGRSRSVHIKSALSLKASDWHVSRHGDAIVISTPPMAGVSVMLDIDEASAVNLSEALLRAVGAR